ncbi:MAG: heavy-metal-associated domain-containing protein [Armatimonadetes bacterium]|jgi:copper chaperone|nr:heavy-metal-associated domain-containing protein [Armatimonadota bacterium]
MQNLELTVEGMTCEGCANAIRRAVGQLEGVQSVAVDVAGKRVAVSYDEGRTSPAAIRERIEAAGYDVVP